MNAGTRHDVRSAERALNVGTWLIVCGAMLYSVLTVTPLMLEHTPSGWELTAPILPIVVDAAVVIVVRLDAVLARLGGRGGAWPILLRWMTGLMTLGLNTADSALKGDPVGVAVHAVAPLLLIVTAETSLAYRRAIAKALARIDAEQREEKERERRERAAREQAAQREREREQAAVERREREAREHAREEREHAARIEGERADREERQRREEREHQARMEHQRLEHAASLRKEEADRKREEAARLEAERATQRVNAAAEHRELPIGATQGRVVHEQPPAFRREAEPARRERQEAATVADEHPATPGRERPKMSEPKAREAVRLGAVHGTSVRALADLTGWSVGWVSARLNETRSTATQPAEEVAA
ncbi:hypothetical protein [Streptomyces sp. NBC_01803]|uniref:hypothetical protein n=1 Tax=Streptomyces sp. NBC_01803 TaxID=2975946 RepID=UPI002DD8B28A|nr:hypothetical protein [Streptomyces sp. NBC_01803]WSA45312.1 hypothetical protein OIE51_14500 [Streptomyces sp. NBC_01803]